MQKIYFQQNTFAKNTFIHEFDNEQNVFLAMYFAIIDVPLPFSKIDCQYPIQYKEKGVAKKFPFR